MYKTLLILSFILGSISSANGGTKRGVAQTQQGLPCGDYFCEESQEKESSTGFMASVLKVYDSTGKVFCTYRAEVPERYKEAVGLEFPNALNRYILTTWQDPGNPGGWTYRILDTSKVPVPLGKPCAFWNNKNHPDGTFFGEYLDGVGLPQKELENKSTEKNELSISFRDDRDSGDGTQFKIMFSCSINNDKDLECKDAKPIKMPNLF